MSSLAEPSCTESALGSTNAPCATARAPSTPAPSSPIVNDSCAAPLAGSTPSAIRRCGAATSSGARHSGANTPCWNSEPHTTSAYSPGAPFTSIVASCPSRTGELATSERDVPGSASTVELITTSGSPPSGGAPHAVDGTPPANQVPMWRTTLVLEMYAPWPAAPWRHETPSVHAAELPPSAVPPDRYSCAFWHTMPLKPFAWYHEPVLIPGR